MDANWIAAISSVALILAAVVTWEHALGSKNENALMVTGGVLMTLGALSAFMIGIF